MDITSTLITLRPPSMILIPPPRLLEMLPSTLRRPPMPGEREAPLTQELFCHWFKVNQDQTQPTTITTPMLSLTKSPLTTPPGGMNTTIKFQNNPQLTPGERATPPTPAKSSHTQSEQ